MSAFNLVDGIPATANKWLLTDFFVTSGDLAVWSLPIIIPSER